jgi:hypothetical protein
VPTIQFFFNKFLLKDPVAERSQRQDLSTRTPYRGFESRLGHECLSSVFSCRVVLSRYRPCEQPFSRSSPIVCRKLIRKPLWVRKTVHAQYIPKNCFNTGCTARVHECILLSLHKTVRFPSESYRVLELSDHFSVQAPIQICIHRN